MLIKYTGDSQNRIVGEYHWTNSPDGRVQEVDDTAVVAEVVGHPGFEIDADEPLLSIASVDEVAQMAVEGHIATVRDLAVLSGTALKEFVEKLTITEAIAKQWVKAAKGLEKISENPPANEGSA